MRSLSWPISKFVNKIRRVFRKLIKYAKKTLKSNKYTYAFFKKMGAALEKRKTDQETVGVEEIVWRMCPKDKWQNQRETEFNKSITFSILVPLFNTPERYLREMIESVIFQTYEKWELCMADGSDSDHSYVSEICKEYSLKDNRIKYKKLSENKGISENTNACIDMAVGNYIALFDHDDFLHPSALYENMKVICQKDADFIYTDEAIFKGDNIFNIVTKHYKPDFAIDNLRANNYICHFSVFRAELLEKTGKFNSKYDGSQDHDMILRLTEKADNICHIPKILYFWRSHPESVAGNIGIKDYAIAAAKNAVNAHLLRSGMQATVESSIAFPTFFKIKYEITSTPKVSIIIIERDGIKVSKKTIASVIKKTTYSNYEIIILTEQQFCKYRKNNHVKSINEANITNASIANNFAITQASGEYIVFLDGNTKIINRDWIQELLMYGQRSDVAAVGAKIYNPNDTISHGGIAISPSEKGVAVNLHYGCDKDDTGYMGKLFYSQNITAVSGTCIMIKTSTYNELGGYDEQLDAPLNHVDFCLKAREKGYLNIFNPYCELYCYNADASAAVSATPKEIEYFISKWKDVIDKGDPYLNHNLVI